MFRCPRCDAPPLEVERVESVGIGRCRRCMLVFDLGKLEGRPSSFAARDPGAPRRLPAPPGLEAWERQARARVAFRDDEGLRELHVRQPWRGTLSVGHTKAFHRYFLAATVLAIPLGALGAYLSRDSRFPGGTVGLFISLVPAAYALVVNHRNHTDVRVRGRELSITHGPMPWVFEGGTYHRDEIEQLYVLEQAHPGRGGSIAFHSYDVMIVRRGQRREVPVIRGIARPEVALYLEAQIEDALGIEDRDVGGYLGRDGVRKPPLPG